MKSKSFCVVNSCIHSRIRIHRRRLFLVAGAIFSYILSKCAFVEQGLLAGQVDSFKLHDDWHPLNRSDRFPSVDQRVQIYMHYWYKPLCQPIHIKYTLEDNGPFTILILPEEKDSEETVFRAIVSPDEKIMLERAVVDDCARTKVQQFIRGPRSNTEELVHNRGRMRSYCQNVQDLMQINDLLDAKNSRVTPLLAHFGDISVIDNRVPMIGKWREAMTTEELERLTTQKCINDRPLKTPSIIWKVETTRHWEPIERSRVKDIQWEEKKLAAIWRGAFTGNGHSRSSMSEIDHCRQNQRCRFVLEHIDSKIIDAGIDDTVGLIADSINGIKITKPRLSMKEIQRYKILISFEGNDVASGLKWNLLSQSVVLMPKPTRTSWAMEELLEPWKHYIPMNENGTNAEEMVQWVLDNDQKAKRISERATLFMCDLLYHPDSEKEEREVKEEIVRRYQEFWL